MKKNKSKKSFIIPGIVLGILIISFVGFGLPRLTGDAIIPRNYYDNKPVASYDWDYCKSQPCSIGLGDCDKDSECTGSLICENNLGKYYDANPLVDVCFCPIDKPWWDGEKCIEYVVQEVIVNNLAGDGNAFICIDSSGRLYRSNNPCTR